MSDLEARLRRWATARENRNGPGGHGETGTQLLLEAADAVRRLSELEQEDERLREGIRNAPSMTCWVRGEAEGDHDRVEFLRSTVYVITAGLAALSEAGGV